MIGREEYLRLRHQYEPERTRLAIIAESPPVNGKYFYNPEGLATEPLFAALMKQLSYSAQSKADGLKELQRRGWVLVDATYEPVDEFINSIRNRIITRDYPLLIDDLVGLIPNRSTPVILIKSNVCRLLRPKLLKDGFKVLNEDPIPFPSTGHQKEFHQLFAAILKSAGVAV